MTMRFNELMTSTHSLTAKTKLVGLASLVAGVLSAGLLAAPSAGAALLECPTASSTFGICPNSFTSSRANNQAGAHSDFTTAFQLNTDALGNTAGQLKNVTISLPRERSATHRPSRTAPTTSFRTSTAPPTRRWASSTQT